MTGVVVFVVVVSNAVVIRPTDCGVVGSCIVDISFEILPYETIVNGVVAAVVVVVLVLGCGR